MFERRDWTTILIAPRKLYSNLNLVQIAQAVSGENFLAEVNSFLDSFTTDVRIWTCSSDGYTDILLFTEIIV